MALLQGCLFPVPPSVWHPNPSSSCHCTHSGPRIPRAPALSSPGESPLCSALLGLVPCWEVLQEPRAKGAVCCLGWVPTLALIHCFSCWEKVRRLGRGRCSPRGRSFGGSFPVGIVLKQHGLVLAPPEAAGRAVPKPSKDLGQSREKKGLILLRTEWSLQGPLWLCSEPGKGGISPLRTTRATGARPLRKQLFKAAFWLFLCWQPSPFLPVPVHLPWCQQMLWKSLAPGVQAEGIVNSSSASALRRKESAG